MITEYWIETDVEKYNNDQIWATIPIFPAETQEKSWKTL